MQKRIAVLVRDRQAEALRMSLGLILVDDTVEVFVLDRRLEASGEIELNLETLKDMDIPIRTNCSENDSLEYLPTAEIGRRLRQYDHILAY